MFLAAIATFLIGSSIAASACEPTANVLVPVDRIIPVDGGRRIESREERQAIKASIGKVTLFAIQTDSSGRVVNHELVCTTISDAALSLAEQSLQRDVFKSGERLKGQTIIRLVLDTNETY